MPEPGNIVGFGSHVIRILARVSGAIAGGGPAGILLEVLTAIAERLQVEAAPALKPTLWAATAILMGLRYPREQVEDLVKGVGTVVLGIRGIEESWVYVYQDILAKGLAEGQAVGSVEEARKILLRQGRKTLGEPDPAVLTRIASIGEVDRLDLLLDPRLDVSTWDELLAALDQ